MPDPFLLILGGIAILTVILYPVRKWRQKHRSYGDDDEAN